MRVDISNIVPTKSVLPDEMESLIPTRFLVTLAHLLAVVMVFYGKVRLGWSACFRSESRRL